MVGKEKEYIAEEKTDVQIGVVHIRAESDVCTVVVCAGVRVVQAAGAKSAVPSGLFHLVRALFLRVGTYMPVFRCGLIGERTGR